MCESFGHDLCYALDDVGGGVMAHERNEYDASLQVYFVPSAPVSVPPVPPPPGPQTSGIAHWPNVMSLQSTMNYWK